MEPVVLEVSQASLEGSVPFCPDADLISPHLMNSFTELLASMHDLRVAALMEDLDLYERTGHMSRLIEDAIRRAHCLAEADRIMESF
jgi:hypothetical protein